MSSNNITLNNGEIVIGSDSLSFDQEHKFKINDIEIGDNEINFGTNKRIHFDSNNNLNINGSTAGLKGNDGEDGATGAQGAIGSQGDTGDQGAIGAQGTTGDDGEDGVTGAQGATGSQGSQGICFLKGTQITLCNKTKKNIENLTMNDIIMTYYIKSIQGKNKTLIKNFSIKELKGVLSTSQIRNIWVNQINSYIIINNKLKITNKHILPVRREDKIIFIEAEKIMLNDELFNENKNYNKILILEQKFGNVNVYNIELQKDYTYFADSYLVHQSCETCSGMSHIIK